jgi:hypothetical protein
MAQSGGLTVRHLTCPCRVAVRPTCPFCAAKRHLARLTSLPAWGSSRPLFPADLRAPNKGKVIEAFRATLAAGGVLTTFEDGDGRKRQRFGGHCLRVSGAQFLSRAGVDLATIQALGRWSSTAV